MRADRAYSLRPPPEVASEMDREIQRRGMTATAWFLDILLNGGLTYSRTRPGIPGRGNGTSIEEPDESLSERE